MSNVNERGDKGDVATPPRRLELRKTVETGQVRQSFSHGRSKTVTVEVKKKRTFTPREGGGFVETAPGAKPAPATLGGKPASATLGAKPAPAITTLSAPPQAAAAPTATAAPAAALRAPSAGVVLKQLTDEEKAGRARALEDAKRQTDSARRRAEEDARQRATEEARLAVEREAALRRAADEEARKKAEEEARRRGEEESKRRLTPEETLAAAKVAAGAPATAEDDEETERKKRGRAGGGGGPGAAAPRAPVLKGRPDAGRRTGRLTVSRALNEDERVRSLAAFRRAREREKRMAQPQEKEPPKKVVRDVVIPEAITVQDLANRMAERGVDVIKALMKLGIMATINQVIDPDTAELVVSEFGHRMRRVTEADVETGLAGDTDADAVLISRPPVVTIMGHVDHGKTSLLDALRLTDVAAHEAGGITQHIGAYQVLTKSGKRITFLDTPGHEAFTAMRARGAKVTDIVVLVVAADDSVMPQTVEAVHHALAAKVPIVVAINKCDRPDAQPDKVRRELLQHGVAVEQMGGDVLAIEVSAKAKTNLDKLEEAILLQAEVLDLKANPARPAEGVVIEAKLERGRGPVATVLVQRGTLRMGDVFVAGAEWGRVRALQDQSGREVDTAGPAMPVEVLGLQGNPEAGDIFTVVENENRAREVSTFRQRRQRLTRSALVTRGTVAEIFSRIKAGEAKELPIVVKTDVQGSLEAIAGSLEKLGTEEVKARMLHAAVGGINESDVTLARASGGIIIGFNVRANKQARDMAARDGVDIRYYSIIYNVIDDVKALLTGMLAPTVREKTLGNAEVRDIFEISKVGKVAGCMVTDGMVKRGAKVRLLRDNVVIHEGDLSTLKHFKNDVREVKQGMECGMSFANYSDLKVGDVIECFELEEIARTL
jgi:translation initiation factor IF-2